MNNRPIDLEIQPPKMDMLKILIRNSGFNEYTLETTAAVRMWRLQGRNWRWVYISSFWFS